jgi:hypothetical protein
MEGLQRAWMHAASDPRSDGAAGGLQVSPRRRRDEIGSGTNSVASPLSATFAEAND